MLVEQIAPFVRFTAQQTFVQGKQDMVAYDHRIYFCLKNNGVITVNGKTYEMPPNSFLLWRAGMPYSYRAADYAAPFEAITCNFDFTRISEKASLPIPPSPLNYFNREKIVSEDVSFENSERFNGVVYIPSAPSLRQLFQNLVKEYNTKLKYYNLKINTLLQSVLLEVARLTEEVRQSKGEKLVSNVLDYVQAQYLSSPSNEDIGKLFNYHPNYINALVLKYTGSTLHNYILTLKMTEAMRLIMETNLNVSEIAEKVGITNTHYFSSLFKKYSGKTPSEFKESHLS